MPADPEPRRPATRPNGAIAAWCLYDWAITPYPTIVVTFVISNYFAKAIAPDPVIGSAEWSYMIAVAGLAIAMLSPPVGAIADRLGRVKRGQPDGHRRRGGAALVRQARARLRPAGPARGRRRQRRGGVGAAVL